MTEVYYAPTKKTNPITVPELHQRLSSAGLSGSSFTEHETVDTHWFCFVDHESTIYTTTKTQYVVFATFNYSTKDDSLILEVIGRVMDSIGFSADEHEDYA